MITGGATGIGLAAAKRFIEEGALVFIYGRRQEALDAAVLARCGCARSMPRSRSPTPEPFVIRAARSDETMLFARLLKAGFTEQDELPPQGAPLVWPPVQAVGDHRLDGVVRWRPRGSASPGIAAEVAALLGKTVLPAFRGRGLQRALIQARLVAARAAGARIAVSATQPGTASAANIGAHRLPGGVSEDRDGELLRTTPLLGGCRRHSAMSDVASPADVGCGAAATGRELVAIDGAPRRAHSLEILVAASVVTDHELGRPRPLLYGKTSCRPSAKPRTLRRTGLQSIGMR